jgi:hypothetical protein
MADETITDTPKRPKKYGWLQCSRCQGESGLYCHICSGKGGWLVPTDPDKAMKALD